MKPATSNLTSRWGLPRPIIKSHAEKSGRGPGLEELPKILEFPFNIFVTAEDSDFKFGMQFGFSKVHQKLLLEEKLAWPWARGLPKRSPLIFLQRLKLATSNLVCSLGFSRHIIKLHPEEKVGVALG